MYKEFVNAHLPKDILELFDSLTVTAVMLGYQIQDSASFLNNYKGVHYDYRFINNAYFFFEIGFYFNIISKEEYKFNKIKIQYSILYFKQHKRFENYENINNIKKAMNKLAKYL